MVQAVTTPGDGCIGMVACPGLTRGLDEDLETLKQWGANAILYLVDHPEEALHV